MTHERWFYFALGVWVGAMLLVVGLLAWGYAYDERLAR